MSFHRSSRGGGAEGPIVQQQPQTQTISTNNCRKIFIQRDYSEGSGVRFQTRFPVELQDKIENLLHLLTNNKDKNVNELLKHDLLA